MLSGVAAVPFLAVLETTMRGVRLYRQRLLAAWMLQENFDEP
jgi:hypothetical protein